MPLMCSAATAQLSSGSLKSSSRARSSESVRHIRTGCAVHRCTLASRRMQKEWRPFIQQIGYASSPARCAFKKASVPWQNERALILYFTCSFRNRIGVRCAPPLTPLCAAPQSRSASDIEQESPSLASGPRQAFEPCWERFAQSSAYHLKTIPGLSDDPGSQMIVVCACAKLSSKNGF